MSGDGGGGRGMNGESEMGGREGSGGRVEVCVNRRKWDYSLTIFHQH